MNIKIGGRNKEFEEKTTCCTLGGYFIPEEGILRMADRQLRRNSETNDCIISQNDAIMTQSTKSQFSIITVFFVNKH